MMKNTLYSLAFIACFFASCNTSEETLALENTSTDERRQEVNKKRNNISVSGITFGTTSSDFETVNDTIVSTLNAIEPISILTEVPFSENAANLGLELNNMKVIIFGNPALGTPLMQQNQLVGLDLPQKLLIFENDNEKVNVAFNNTSYLKARHGLENTETLTTINSALTNFTTTATSDSRFSTTSSRSIQEGEGIITKISTQTFQESYDSLVAAITNNANLTLFAEHDHAENAAAIGLELNPTSLVIFGNPSLGTALMQSTQTSGIDLPQKMLIWEDEEGVVRVSYNDPEYLTSRHGSVGVEETEAAFVTGLNALSNAAAGL